MNILGNKSGAAEAAPTVAPVLFPEPKAVAEIKTLVAQRTECLKNIEENETKLSAARSNYKLLVATDKDPDQIIHSRSRELRRLEDHLSSIKDRLVNLCLDGPRKALAIRKSLWEGAMDAFVRPRADRLSAFAKTLSELTDEIVGALVAGLPALKQFESRCSEWNKLMHESGAPANSRIPETTFGDNLRASLLEQSKPSLMDIQENLNRLRAAYGLGPVLSEQEWNSPDPKPIPRFRTPMEIFGPPEQRPDPSSPTGYSG